ncbi:Alpha/Beta hydrolase protein [Chytriomyces sp. MP71]|nr:Alpha/Beta hydrolase protein [Chytriomyces sp. MP71]
MLATAIRNGAKVKVEPGRGIWIAQFVQHLDNVDADDCVVMLYFHGGSFCFNTPETNAPWLLQFIKEFNAKEPHRRLVVFSVEYPLAPQHRFPAQLEASINAYRWLTTEVGIRTLFLCGDNAGGHLAISLLNTLNISDASSPEDLPDRVHPSCNSTPSTIPFASILFSPWVDPSMRYNAPHDGRVFDSISREGSRFAALNAFGNLDDDNETQPIAFSSRPGFAAAPLDDEYSRDLRHHRAQRDLYAIPIPDVRLALRGTLIVYGGAELLAPAVARFAHTLRTRMELEASSALLEVVSFEGMPHDFHLASFGSLKKPAVEARALAVSFLHKCLPSATSDLSP